MALPTLGRYKLIAELARGGMADVLLAVTDTATGVDFTKLVVIKKVRDEFSSDLEFATMIVDEARIAARLNHPNVVQTIEVGHNGRELFLAMEYLDGQPLSRVLHRASGRIGLGMRLSMISDALAGLHHAHELADYDRTPLSIVHRDFTPHNVFVTYDGQVKVMDFGIAKAVGRATRTRAGVVKGKVSYMAPEQVLFSSGDSDRRVDVFAAGVMLFEACTGERLWKDVPDDDVLQRLAHGDVPRHPRDRRPSVHPELDRICARALAPKPADRYPTAAALQDDLDAFVSEHERRPSLRQIGTFVSELFTDRREATRSLIEAQLSGIVSERKQLSLVSFTAELGPESMSTPTASQLAHVSVSIPPDDVATSIGTGSKKVRLPPDANPAAPPEDTAPASEPTEASTSADEAEEPSQPPVEATTSQTSAASGAAPAGRGARALVAAIGLVVLGGGAALGVMRASATSERKAEITVTLRAAPMEAQFEIDGNPPVENPFITRRTKDGEVHHIRASAPGYESQTEDVRFDADVSIRFALAKRSAP